jgi:putative PIN family toxin of toxin-antitoxin system
VRAVLDVNVLISGLLSREGSPGRIIALWLDGAFELVVSEALLAELHRALRYPGLRRHIAEEDGDAFIELLRSMALVGVDVPRPDPVSRDPGDDYLVALAKGSNSILVTGDDDLLDLAPELPIQSPASFLARLEPSAE